MKYVYFIGTRQSSGGISSQGTFVSGLTQTIDVSVSQGASGWTIYMSVASHESPLGGLAWTSVVVLYLRPEHLSVCTSSENGKTSPGQISRSATGTLESRSITKADGVGPSIAKVAVQELSVMQVGPTFSTV